jgi:hypothetical protein
MNLLTALAFGFVCFLGMNYYTLGDSTQSIIFAVVIALSLAGTSFLAILLKKTKNNFGAKFILEILVLIIFTGLLAFFTYSPFSHFFVVTDQKKNIQRKLTASITQAENMFSEYENYANSRISLYKSSLKSAVVTKIANSKPYKDLGLDGNNNIPDSAKIESKMQTIQFDLYPSNYSDTINNNGIKEVAAKWLLDAKSAANNWKAISIVNIVNDVEKNSNEWLDTLVQISTVPEIGEESIDFTHKLSFEDMKTHFTTLGKPTLLSIILAMIAWLVMLFPYMIETRNTKSNYGFRAIFTRKQTNKGQYDIEY